MTWATTGCIGGASKAPGWPNAASPPRYVEGARRAPPEDVGGWPGFEVFLDAMADPAHPEHEEKRDWYGEPFNPEAIDVDAINARLARIAKRRR